MSVWIGGGAVLLWSYHHGSTTDGDWSRFLEALRSFSKNHSGAGAVLTVIHRASPPNARQRRALGELIASAPFGPSWGHAMVTDSKVIAGVAKALDWLVKKQYRERIFEDPFEALDWLKSLEPSLDGMAAVSEILAAVPPRALMPALRRERRRQV